MKTLQQSPEWQALIRHKDAIAATHMREWFTKEPNRFAHFSLRLNGLLLDYSKNRITKDTLPLLINLANAANLKEKITALFAGQTVNQSENRAALHMALRAPKSATILQQNENIIPAIHAALNQMRQFTDKVRNKEWLGHTGKPICSIVNIGIGGSHLGPLMVTHALKKYASSELACHFISNIDTAHLQDVLQQINPETTLFIVSSKSFTTLETLTNANTLRQWLQEKLNTPKIDKHFVAVTAAKNSALAFGIAEENIFPLWEWVGGRYSLWSAIGLPLALMIGMDAFHELLAGAHAIDEHFQHADFANNIPVILALLGIWYINFFHAPHHAVIPYSHYLQYLRAHLQQLDMESNGKTVSQHGHAIDFVTGAVMLGEQGCNGQHAFHQLLHQGSHLIPVDFILVGIDQENFTNHQDILISSGLSQAQALMQGKTWQEAKSELEAKGFSPIESGRLAQHKAVPGNRPSNTLFLEKMTPFNLGMLLALYEHKTFVQGAIWEINSFDQWGVELGKTLLPEILQNLQTTDTHGSLDSSTDSSTKGLIEYYKNLRNSI